MLSCTSIKKQKYIEKNIFYFLIKRCKIINNNVIKMNKQFGKKIENL